MMFCQYISWTFLNVFLMYNYTGNAVVCLYREYVDSVEP